MIKVIKDIWSVVFVVFSWLYGCIMLYVLNMLFVFLYCDKKMEYFVDSYIDKKGYEVV